MLSCFSQRTGCSTSNLLAWLKEGKYVCFFLRWVYGCKCLFPLYLYRENELRPLWSCRTCCSKLIQPVSDAWHFATFLSPLLLGFQSIPSRMIAWGARGRLIHDKLPCVTTALAQLQLASWPQNPANLYDLLATYDCCETESCNVGKDTVYGNIKWAFEPLSCGLDMSYKGWASRSTGHGRTDCNTLRNLSIHVIHKSSAPGTANRW